MTPAKPIDEFSALRARMVDEQIRARGVRDRRVLQTMTSVPRHEFLPPDIIQQAYADRAVGIGHGQTISQPFIVAFMTEQLGVDPDSRVLEIGTGSGYQTAILSELALHVFTVERISALHQRAKALLQRLGVTNVSLFESDGTLGLPDAAPFDRIMVTAAGPTVPPTLISQLAEGGVLVIPVGNRGTQTIVKVRCRRGRTVETPLLACRFVKLIGEEGWAPAD